MQLLHDRPLRPLPGPCSKGEREGENVLPQSTQLQGNCTGLRNPRMALECIHRASAASAAARTAEPVPLRPGPG
jgi:hypothetical protein